MAGVLNPVSTPPTPLTGTKSVMAYELDMNGHVISNVAAPVNPSDAARKQDTEGITLPVLNANGVQFNVALSK